MEAFHAAYKREFSVFFDAAIQRDPARVRSPYRDGIRWLAVILGAVESAREGGLPVDLTKEPYVVD